MYEVQGAAVERVFLETVSPNCYNIGDSLLVTHSDLPPTLIHTPGIVKGNFVCVDGVIHCQASVTLQK